MRKKKYSPNAIKTQQLTRFAGVADPESLHNMSLKVVGGMNNLSSSKIRQMDTRAGSISSVNFDSGINTGSKFSTSRIVCEGSNFHLEALSPYRNKSIPTYVAPPIPEPPPIPRLPNVKLKDVDIAETEYHPAETEYHPAEWARWMVSNFNSAIPLNWYRKPQVGHITFAPEGYINNGNATGIRYLDQLEDPEQCYDSITFWNELQSIISSILNHPDHSGIIRIGLPDDLSGYSSYIERQQGENPVYTTAEEVFKDFGGVLYDEVHNGGFRRKINGHLIGRGLIEEGDDIGPHLYEDLLYFCTKIKALTMLPSDKWLFHYYEYLDLRLERLDLFGYTLYSPIIKGAPAIEKWKLISVMGSYFKATTDNPLPINVYTIDDQILTIKMPKDDNWTSVWHDTRVPPKWMRGMPEYHYFGRPYIIPFIDNVPSKFLPQTYYGGSEGSTLG